MKKAIIKNGLISTAILVAVNLISLVVFGTDPDNYGIGEIVGYATIVCALILVFIGIRELEFSSTNNSFLKKMLVGSGISGFPAVAFGLYNVIYVKWIDPDFMETYTQYSLDKMQAEMSPEEFEIAKAQTMEQMAMFDNLFVQFVIMFMTVFVIGLIISLLSATYFQVKPIRK
ncbi:MAG: DUF4199 domain-containing protein [Cyclobacteriaceae bacterium]